MYINPQFSHAGVFLTESKRGSSGIPCRPPYSAKKARAGMVTFQTNKPKDKNDECKIADQSNGSSQTGP